MRMHRTSCEKCQLQWMNKDDRDYSHDACPNCHGGLKHEVVESKMNLQNPLIYNFVPKAGFE